MRVDPEKRMLAHYEILEKLGERGMGIVYRGRGYEAGPYGGFEIPGSETDGTHPSMSGREKVAGLLMAFLKSDRTAKPWFKK